MKNILYFFTAVVFATSSYFVFKEKITSSKRSIASVKSDFNLQNNILKMNIKSTRDLEKVAKSKNLSRGSIEGLLHEEIVEDFKKHTIEKSIYVSDSYGNKQKIHLLNSQDRQFLGKRVQAQFIEDDNKLYSLIDKSRFHYKTSRPKKKRAILFKKMLLLLVEFDDTYYGIEGNETGAGLSGDKIVSTLNTGSFKQYFQEMTRGEVRNSITKYIGWKRLPGKGSDYLHYGYQNRRCFVPRDKIIEMIKEEGIDHRQFDNISIVSRCYKNWAWGVASSMTFPDGHRVTTSFSSVGRNWLHFASSSNPLPDWSHFFVGLFTHERLHNFGIGHASGIDCGQSKVLFPCKSVTYANPYDIMGVGYSANAMNAHSLAEKGWRDKKTNFLHIRKPGIYHINPLLDQNRRARIGAYIYSPFTEDKERPVFMLENRTARGVDIDLARLEFNNVLNGLTLYSSISDTYGRSDRSPYIGGSKMRLVDTDPSNYVTNSFHDRVKFDAIHLKKSYFDPITGIGIEVLPNRPIRRRGRRRLRRFGRRYRRGPYLQSPWRPGVTFRVTYSKRKRACFKQRVGQQVSRAYLHKEGLSIGNDIKYRKVRLRNGEQFSFKFDTHLTNMMMCPRDKVEVSILNSKYVLSSWAKIAPPLVEDWSGGSIGNEQTIPEKYIRNVSDYEGSHFLTTRLQVKEDAIPGRYRVPVQYRNVRSGERMKSFIEVHIGQVPDKSDFIHYGGSKNIRGKRLRYRK